MKKRRLGFLAFLLTAAVSLGVGYSALQRAFVVLNTVTPATNEANLVCKFFTDASNEITKDSVAQTEGTNITIEVSEFANNTCKVSFSGLSTAGDTAWVEIPVINASEHAVGNELDAQLQATPEIGNFTEHDAEHLTVSASWVSNDLILEAARIENGQQIPAGINRLKIQVTIKETVTNVEQGEFHSFNVNFTATTISQLQ